MRFGQSNKWLRKSVEQLRDDDLLDLYEQMLDDGEEQTRYGVAIIDEVQARWESRMLEVRELQTELADTRRQAESYSHEQLIIDEIEKMIDDLSMSESITRAEAADSIQQISTLLREDAVTGDEQ